MPYPLPADARAMFEAGRMAPALLVDLYTSPVRRWWLWPGDLLYPANDSIDGASEVTYVSIEGRMQVDYAVKASASLSSEPLVITLDGSRAGDNDDAIGAWVDQDWHQRSVRARLVLLDFDTRLSPTDPVWEWRGRMDHRAFNRQPGEDSRIVLTCEGGLFRIRGRRMHTRTDQDQRRRLSSDRFFDLTPVMVTRQPVWGKSIANIPGTTGGGGGGGGVNGRIFNVPDDA